MITKFFQIKKVGGLAILMPKHFRPITLRPILSDSLPLSTLNYIDMLTYIFKLLFLYIIFPKK